MRDIMAYTKNEIEQLRIKLINYFLNEYEKNNYNYLAFCELWHITNANNDEVIKIYNEYMEQLETNKMLKK